MNNEPTSKPAPADEEVAVITNCEVALPNDDNEQVRVFVRRPKVKLRVLLDSIEASALEDNLNLEEIRRMKHDAIQDAVAGLHRKR